MVAVVVSSMKVRPARIKPRPEPAMGNPPRLQRVGGHCRKRKREKGGGWGRAAPVAACAWPWCWSGEGGVGRCSPRPEGDLVTGLPGQPGVGFKHYAGYVDVGMGGDKVLFYWFFEAEKGPEKKPLMLWAMAQRRRRRSMPRRRTSRRRRP
ncbi:hypothetical protein ACQJBY_060597 [Aegilops geniculata]